MPEYLIRCSHTQAHVRSFSVVPVNKTLKRSVIPNLGTQGAEKALYLTIGLRVPGPSQYVLDGLSLHKFLELCVTLLLVLAIHSVEL